MTHEESHKGNFKLYKGLTFYWILEKVFITFKQEKLFLKMKFKLLFFLYIK